MQTCTLTMSKIRLGPQVHEDQRTTCFPSKTVVSDEKYNILFVNINTTGCPLSKKKYLSAVNINTINTKVDTGFMPVMRLVHGWKKIEVGLYVKSSSNNAGSFHDAKLFNKPIKKCDEVQTANLTTVTNQNDFEE